MMIDKTINDKKAEFFIEGRLDTVTGPELQDELIPAFDSYTDVILDFAQVNYISSAGLRVLLIGQKTAAAKKALFTIRNVSDEVMEILNMTGFSDILTIV